MEPEIEKLCRELQWYRLLLGSVTGRLAVEALKRLICEGEAQLRALEREESSSPRDARKITKA
jgi:hypothetical protein